MTINMLMIKIYLFYLRVFFFYCPQSTNIRPTISHMYVFNQYNSSFVIDGLDFQKKNVLVIAVYANIFTSLSSTQQKPTSTFPDAFAQIAGVEGLGALWNGTLPSLLLVLNPAIQFMIYEGLKRQLSRGVHTEVIRGGVRAT